MHNYSTPYRPGIKSQYPQKAASKERRNGFDHRFTKMNRHIKCAIGNIDPGPTYFKKARTKNPLKKYSMDTKSKP